MKKAIIAAAGAALAVPFLVIGTPVAHADMCQIWASLGATRSFKRAKNSSNRMRQTLLKTRTAIVSTAHQLQAHACTHRSHPNCPERKQ